MDSEISETAATTPRRREGGFTLVELLIVIVILGVLSTVAVFAVQGNGGAPRGRGDDRATSLRSDDGQLITDEGVLAVCQGDYKTLETGIEAYMAQTPSATGVVGQQVLIDNDLLRAPGSSKYEIVSATDIDPVAGGSCTIYDPDDGITGLEG